MLSNQAEKVVLKASAFYKYRFILLYINCFLISCSYGFIYLLSLFVSNYGGDAINVGAVLAIAGVVTLMCVGFSGAIAQKIGAVNVCMFGSICCALGFFLIDQAHGLSLLFYSSGLFVGLGWSFYYAASPMIITNQVADQSRGKYLGHIAAFVVLGTGCGPILGKYLLANDVPVAAIYSYPAMIAMFAALMFFIQKPLWREELKNQTQGKQFNLITIITSEAKYPLVMVFLGACIFSSMMNFQTLYANTRQLDYIVYYAAYMFSVVGSRLVFSGLLTHKNPISASPYLLLLMCVGLLAMLLNTHSEIIYALSAMALGISYGLVYPLIKTYAVNVTATHLRHEVLAYFTLAYFIGVYLFPLLGGFVIRIGGEKSFLGLLLGICIVDMAIGYYRGKAKSSILP